MNPMNSKSSTTSRLPEIVAIILVVVAVGYYFYSSSGSNNSSASFTVSTATTSVGASVLNLLNQIHSLRIDTTLFTTPAYESLTDFTVQVPAEPIGKSNPFVTGGATTNISSATTTSSSTPIGSASIH